MNTPNTFPDSPVSPAFVAAGKRLSSLSWSPDGRHLGWLETRSGKGVAVLGDDTADASRDLTSDISVRARVGYGGGDLCLTSSSVLYAADEQLWIQPLTSGSRKPLCEVSGSGAAMVVSPDERWVIYVQSDGVTDRLMAANLETMASAAPLVEGAAFYMQPAWHPNGRMIAWVQWDHPNMPWESTELHVADIIVQDDRLLVANDRVVAGGQGIVAVQPEFSADGCLMSYVCDSNGWTSLYVMDLGTEEHRVLLTGEFEVGAPAWVQGVRTTAWHPDSYSIYAIVNDMGLMHMMQVDVETGESRSVEDLEEYSYISGLSVSSQGELAFIGGSATIPNRIVTFCLASGRKRIRARSEGETLPQTMLSQPEPLTWPTVDGTSVYGLLYEPVCCDAETLPPLLVRIHGGPTGQALANYDPAVQFFTTRGFAVLAVNYRGSSGYGRQYMERLNGQWGITDSQDAMTGASYIIKSGRANEDQVVIMGGSAGGLTVLQSLIMYPGFYAAGLCLYGVSDLERLTRDTHKFEQHYTDSLVGVLPDDQQTYRDRSPVYHADRIMDPVGIFQGAEDIVVPPSQSEAIVSALKENNVPHLYCVYEGEGHGWRRAETIISFYETVLEFLEEHVLDKSQGLEGAE